MADNSVLIQIGAQTAQAVREIGKVNTALGDQMTATDKMKNGLKSAAVPAAAAFTAIAAGALKTAAAAEEANAAQAALNQVFESMGYKENAQAASDYADELSRMIGVDDEVIKGAQTKLATFSQVAASTELMGQATSVAADLTAAGFGDMSSNAVLVGKALQDPVKGMTALTRVGVTLTEQQKEQIKTMTAAGDVAGAQAIIMGALESQVGGVAEASATASDKTKVAFGEMEEAIGQAALPLLNELNPALQTFADFVANNSTAVAVIAGVIGTLAAAILVLNAAMAAWSAVTAIWTVVTTIATAVGSAFAAVVAVITSPVTLVILAILALIAVVVLLWKNWDTITKWLGQAWEWLKVKAIAVFEAIKRAISAVWDWVKRNWPLLLGILTGPIGLAVALIARYWDQIKAAAAGAFTAMKAAVTSGIKAVLGLMRDLPGQIVNAIGNLSRTLYGAGQDLIRGLINGIKSLLGNIGSTISNAIPDWVPGFGMMPAGGGGSTSLGVSGHAAGGNTTIVNWYGSGGAAEAREVKRILEADDLRQGRPRGAALRVAW